LSLHWSIKNEVDVREAIREALLVAAKDFKGVDFERFETYQLADMPRLKVTQAETNQDENSSTQRVSFVVSGFIAEPANGQSWLDENGICQPAIYKDLDLIRSDIRTALDKLNFSNCASVRIVNHSTDVYVKEAARPFLCFRFWVTAEFLPNFQRN
jgi:hypothetical protein